MGNLETPRKAASPKTMAVSISLALMVLAIAIAAFLHSSLISPLSLTKSTIGEIVFNPTAWENKAVRIEGTIQRIALGIIYPFNYWLSSDRNQTVRIGVRWHAESDLSGKHVVVVGVVTHDYAWVHPDHPGWQIHFVKASLVYEVF